MNITFCKSFTFENGAINFVLKDMGKDEQGESCLKLAVSFAYSKGGQPGTLDMFIGNGSFNGTNESLIELLDSMDEEQAKNVWAEVCAEAVLKEAMAVGVTNHLTQMLPPELIDKLKEMPGPEDDDTPPGITKH